MAHLILTDQTLGEVVFALRTSLGRVREDDLGSSAARTNWRSAQRWLDEAEAFRGATTTSEYGFIRLKPFPLSGLDLRTLQTEVDLAVARRVVQQASLATPAARHRPAPAVPHESIGRVKGTSLVLAAALLLSLLVNIAWFVFPRLGIIEIPHLSVILALNSAVTLATLGVWAVHVLRLRQHAVSLDWHLPLEFLHLPARS